MYMLRACTDAAASAQPRNLVGHNDILLVRSHTQQQLHELAEQTRVLLAHLAQGHTVKPPEPCIELDGDRGVSRLLCQERELRVSGAKCKSRTYLACDRTGEHGLVNFVVFLREEVACLEDT